MDFRKHVELPTENLFIPEDVIISGNLLTLIKSKGWLFNRYSKVAFRRVVILANGMMMVYNKPRKGWTMSLHQLKCWKTTTTTQKGGSYDGSKRTQFEFKTNSGNIQLVALGTESTVWMEAFTRAMTTDTTNASRECRPAQANCSMVSLFEEPGVLTTNMMEEVEEATEVIEEENEELKNEEVKVVPCKKKHFFSLTIVHPSQKLITKEPFPKKKPTTAPIKQKATLKTKTSTKIWRRPASPLPPSTMLTESEETESIRHGSMSVATLKNILEEKARTSLREGRKSKGAVPTAVLMAEMKKNDETKHLASGISFSAPSVFLFDKESRKKMISGSYDGCFNSIRA